MEQPKKLTTEEKKALDKKIADKQKLITDKKIIIK